MPSREATNDQPQAYAARGDHACLVSPQNCNPNITLKKKPSEYLNQLYFDAMVFTPEGLRHLVAQVGASQVVLGTGIRSPGNSTRSTMSWRPPVSPTNRMRRYWEATQRAYSG